MTMTQAPPPSPEAMFRRLADIERRARLGSTGLPHYHRAEENWDGVLFMLGNISLLAPLDQVKEILNLPHTVTRVPGAKSWVLGIANMRGTLLPVIDLGAFLFERPTRQTPRSRVLVVSHEGFRSGLLVGETVAMRHFWLRERVPTETGGSRLLGFLSFAFLRDNHRWPVFNVARLLADPEFQAAAA